MPPPNDAHHDANGEQRKRLDPEARERNAGAVALRDPGKERRRDQIDQEERLRRR